jgi:hypothetical protein
VARKRSGHLISLDIIFGPDAAYAIRYMIEVDYMPVNYRVGLKIVMSDVNKLETASRGFELDCLERTRTYVQTYDALLLFP